MADTRPEEPLLRIEHLSVRYATSVGPLVALDGVSLEVAHGEILALVGESGAGKSSLALALMGLLPGSARVGGRATLEGVDLLALPPTIPRSALAMVFQEPAAALHPLWRIGALVAEPLRQRWRLSRADAATETRRLLALAGLPEPEELIGAFPHQLSGGQQQRVLLAMALACRPRLLLADEPTTALDAATRAGVLAQLGTLSRQLGLAILLVSHDPLVVASVATRAAVFYAGHLVEVAPARVLLARPAHPYTQALLACAPDASGQSGPPRPIPGQAPDALAQPAGCAFLPRCPRRTERCRRAPPSMRPVAGSPGHRLACHGEEPAWA